MKIYTKSGDTGNTSLVGGSKTPKDDERVDAYGEIDELNSFIGLVVSRIEDKPLLDELKDKLTFIQNLLFEVGTGLATPTLTETIKKEDIDTIEKWIDTYSETLPALQSFILPGGSEVAARFHVLRTITRRAERRIVKLNNDQPISSLMIPFINRLSDLFFVLARYSNFRLGYNDVVWTSRQKKES